MNGFLIIDKPKGITSQGVCTKIKHALNAKRVGHNGTLDPNATGLMIVAVNQATKLLKFMEIHDKEYVVTVLFGITTDSLDMDRPITDRKEMSFGMEDILSAMERLKKEESQIPPLTSAIKIDGKKLYEYQREGHEIKPEARSVRLYDYEILSPLYECDGYQAIDMRVFVSKGYFIRSLARDLGEILGGYAVVGKLRRTKSGDNDIKDAIPLEEVSEDALIPVESFLKLPYVDVLDYMIPLVRNGITLDERQTSLRGAFYVRSKAGVLGIYEEKDEFEYKPVVLFGGE